MPPKGGDSKKSVEKKKKAIVEDRTFGLKNKNKSKKVQQYVKAVETSVAAAGMASKERREQERAKAMKEAAKAAKEAAEMEKAALFKSVVNKTVVPQGADPKSVLCEFFKAGKCARGANCKYSHDMEVARKSAKINLYADPRAMKQADTIDTWDTAKLEEVVKQKLKGKLPPTDIICKHFLDAVENSQYGWFWECPSGESCHYRHCLPPGYVLKTKADKERERRMKEQGGDDEEDTLEERIDQQRKALDLSKCTPLTLELFKKWKVDKETRRLDEVKKKASEAEAKQKGSGMHVMSGRDLFTFDPSLFVDDEEADEELYEIDESYQPQNNEDDEEDEAPHYGDDDDEDEEGEDGDDIAEGEEEEDDGEERKESDKAKSASAAAASASAAAASSKSDPQVDAAAGAIDASLFLDDEELPDE